MKSIYRILFSLLLMTFAQASVFGDSAVTTKRTINQLADGIYEIRHPDAPDGFPQSNTTIITSSQGVFVVDSCLLQELVVHSDCCAAQPTHFVHLLNAFVVDVDAGEC